MAACLQTNNCGKFEEVFMMDDKQSVILAVTIIALTSMWAQPVDTTLLVAVVSGLFGVAVGKAL